MRIADLESMYVSEEYRGFGFGVKLAAEFLSWAVEKGAERSSVTAYATNRRAISFYESLGFYPARVSLEMEV